MSKIIALVAPERDDTYPDYAIAVSMSDSEANKLVTEINAEISRRIYGNDKVTGLVAYAVCYELDEFQNIDTAIVEEFASRAEFLQ